MIFFDRPRPFRGEQLASLEAISDFNVEAAEFRSYGAFSKASVARNYSVKRAFPGWLILPAQY